MIVKPTVIEALTAVMADVQPVGKAQRNTEQGYNFRGIDAVVNAVGPVLRKHGVIVLPMLEKTSYRDVTTSRGKPSREVTVEVRYRFYGPAGDFIDAVVPGESMDFGDKGSAKAMSVAYRIVLLQALCIPTDEPDPDEHSYERASRDEPEDRRSPSLRAVTLFESITNAVDADALNALWIDAQAAAKASEITAAECAQLKAHILKRGEAMKPAGDVDAQESA